MSKEKNMDLEKNVYQKEKLEQKPTRNGYGQGLVELGKRSEDVVVLCADLTGSTRSAMFQKEFPDRFIQVGIAEQNMLSIAAGLAFSGKVPFVSTYGVFCPGRNWDQLRVNVCYSKANVKLTGAHTGVSVGPDGATHQALEDIAITRCLPNMTVLAPCDMIETKKATIAAGEIKGPVYLRFAREATPIFTTVKTPFQIGQAEVFKQGKDVSVIACGPTVHEALLAAHDLAKENISVAVVNNHTIKPMDEKTIIEAAKTGAVVTAEDHQVMGGLGSAVAEVLATSLPAGRQVPMEMIAVQDRFGESGQPEELMKEYGLLAEDIKQAIKKVIKRK
jgi:transketolase|tara:strand:+ start:13158 stop:14156 length:999 start_codon:yes stop_codon:yes gene_type:complete